MVVKLHLFPVSSSPRTAIRAALNTKPVEGQFKFWFLSRSQQQDKEVRKVIDKQLLSCRTLKTSIELLVQPFTVSIESIHQISVSFLLILHSAFTHGWYHQNCEDYLQGMCYLKLIHLEEEGRGHNLVLGFRAPGWFYVSWKGSEPVAWQLWTPPRNSEQIQCQLLTSFSTARSPFSKFNLSIK